MDNNRLRLIAYLKLFIKDLFNLHEDKEREETTIAEIRKGVVFKGANLWILIFAIFIASIGLNVNSTAVVIGAMLISPLMGPIIGIGLGAGINDFDLIKKAFKNLSVAVLISVLTSTTYFLITPLHEAQSELLARTTPTLWDVLIALFGGLAGIVAGSRKEKSNAIPGVAIATALMPPLCTAGYGLANANWYYFIGAFYLFFINSVIISAATFIVVRALKYPRVQFQDKATEVRVKNSIVVFVLITVIPSVYLAYRVVSRTIFEQNARNFVATEFAMDEAQVISQRYSIDEDNQRTIEVTLYGKRIEKEAIEKIKEEMPVYGLDKVKLIVRQGYQEDVAATAQREFEKYSESLKAGVLQDLYDKGEAALRSKDKKIELLENELLRMQKKRYPVLDIEEELRVQYPNLKNMVIGDMITTTEDTVCYAVVTTNDRLNRTEKRKIDQWLQLRTDADSLIVVFQ